MGKTFLITGGAGFIGSSLADKLLAENNKVIVIDNFNDYYDPKLKEKNVEKHLNNNNYTLYRIDIRNKDDIFKVFKENKIDLVIHLAACAGVRPSIMNPQLYQDVNCMGTLNIFEAMKDSNIKKLVFASSSSVYGNCKTVPFKETDQVDFAISPYAATKKASEVMGYVYHNLYNIDMALLRFFTVYGPRQRPDLAINKFTKLIMENKPIPLYGDGSTSRDYTFIEDILDGIEKSINWLFNNEKVYEIFNLGESTPITLLDMVKTIEESLNKKAEIDWQPMQSGDVEITYADISKAKKMLKYDPKTTFKDGISKFIEWLNNNE